MVPSVRQTGRAAAAAGVLMLIGVEGEWVFDPQADDGTVTNLPVFALLLLTATIGFALLFLAVLGLRALAPTTRPARVGAFLSLVGAGFLVVFGLTVIVTSLTTGSPLEASFIPFLLGMLLLSVGAFTWGLSLRRHSPASGVWQMLSLSGVGTFAALAFETDPWHDLGLVVMYAAWTALGVLLLHSGARPALGSTPPRRAGTAPAPRRTAPSDRA